MTSVINTNAFFDLQVPLGTDRRHSRGDDEPVADVGNVLVGVEDRLSQQYAIGKGPGVLLPQGRPPPREEPREEPREPPRVPPREPPREPPLTITPLDSTGSEECKAA